MKQKYKVVELEGALLDAAVADIELGYPWRERSATPMEREVTDGGWAYAAFSPSTEWSQAGPIIDRERISLIAEPDGTWIADVEDHYTARASAPLVAAMRAFVASKLDAEDELG